MISRIASGLTLGVLFALAPTVRATFSIVAFDPKTGDLGVAVQSKVLGVGSIVPWAEAGVGAVATQALANVHFGTEGLKLMRAGNPPAEIRKELAEADPERDLRQFLLIDAKGSTAAHTGDRCLDWAGHREGKHYAVAGNILAGEAVVNAMADAFEKARDQGEGELAEWLLAALAAGQDAGGD